MVNMAMKKFVLNLLRGFNQYLELIQWTVILSLVKILHIISRNLEMVQDRRSLITNRKSYMGFRLVPKSVTLNDLERCYGHYFALFRGIR